MVTSIAYGVTLTDDPLLIGIIGAAYGLTYLITPAVLGWLGDKFPRKTSLLIASSGQFVIALYFLIFAGTPLLLIIGQVLLGIFYGFYWPSIEAFTSETSYSDGILTSDQAHKKNILSFCIAWSIGYMIGPLLAGIFADYFLPGAFITVIVVYVVEFFLILANLPTRMESTSEKKSNKSNQQVPLIRQSQRTHWSLYLELIVTVFVYAGISKVLYTYFVDYALDPNGLMWSDSTTGLILFLFGLGRTLFFILNYFYIQIQSSIKLILYSLLGMGLCILGIAFFRHPVVISALMLLAGISAAIIYSSTLDLMLHQAVQAKGAKAGLYESMIGLGSIVSPVVAGGIARKSSLTTPFLVFAGITLGIFTVFFIIEYLFRKKQG
ncbi:MAG: MFS transporter [Candidatus Lokiarchaeota archaeon]|nr:MFS transporter [Candidatus Lokiarchaeota archaeon]